MTVTVSPKRPLDASEIMHVVARVLETPLSLVPCPYLQIDNVFPPPAYRRLSENFPRAKDGFGRWIHGGDPSLFHGNYAKRLEIKLPQEIEKIDEGARGLWAGFAETFMAPAFLRVLANKFSLHLKSVFGPEMDAGVISETQLRTTMEINRHEKDYYLGPHTDRFEKIATCIFYFPERDDVEGLGTSLYRPKQDGFTCRGMVHHAFDQFEKIGQIPFRPNSAFIFARTDTGFHAVEPIGEPLASMSDRPIVQIQIWRR